MEEARKRFFSAGGGMNEQGGARVIAGGRSARRVMTGRPEPKPKLSKNAQEFRDFAEFASREKLKKQLAIQNNQQRLDKDTLAAGHQNQLALNEQQGGIQAQRDDRISQSQLERDRLAGRLARERDTRALGANALLAGANPVEAQRVFNTTGDFNADFSRLDVPLKTRESTPFRIVSGGEDDDGRINYLLNQATGETRQLGGADQLVQPAPEQSASALQRQAALQSTVQSIQTLIDSGDNENAMKQLSNIAKTNPDQYQAILSMFNRQ